MHVGWVSSCSCVQSAGIEKVKSKRRGNVVINEVRMWNTQILKENKSPPTMAEFFQNPTTLLNGKHPFSTHVSTCDFVFSQPFGLCVYPSSLPGPFKAYLPMPPPPPDLRCYQPAAGLERPDRRATQAARWLLQSIMSQKTSIIADGWWVWLAAGLAEQAHFRAVWSAGPTVLRRAGGGQQIEWEDLVNRCWNNGGEMVVMRRYSSAKAIMRRGKGG